MIATFHPQWYFSECSCCSLLERIWIVQCITRIFIHKHQNSHLSAISMKEKLIAEQGWRGEPAMWLFHAENSWTLASPVTPLFSNSIQPLLG